MGARFRSWCERIKWHRVAIVVVAIVLVVVIALIIIGYKFDWIGFNEYTGPQLKPNQQYRPEKTFWDWMQLLLIPIVLAAAGFWFNHRERKATELRAENERKTAELYREAELEISFDNQRQALLQAYLDRMAELLLEKNLRKSEISDEVRSVARARTLSVLPQLNGSRKRILIQFLQETDLLNIISLRGADLSKANLRYGVLRGANLYNVDLSGADLYSAKLGGLDLRRAFFNNSNLCKIDLSGSNLTGADLSNANLSGANLAEANLKGVIGITKEELEKQACSLKGAIMPDGDIHS